LGIIFTKLRGQTVIDRIVKAYFTAFFLFLLTPLAALAQTAHWVQIEAHATLRTAEEFAARYNGRIGSIVGFRIAGGWYALAVGPFASPEEAERRRGELIATREIREDSYVTDSAIYGQQFWPVGGQVAEPVTATTETTQPPAQQDTANPAPVAETAPVAEVVAPVVEPVVEPTPEPAAPDLASLPEESVADARALERALTRDERAEIQVALQWYGFYRSIIDADFGPGTRNAIMNWQRANEVDPSGFLTTRQRAMLVGGYQSAVARYAFGPFRDEAAGIEVTLPLGMVAFARHEAPFSHLDAINNSGMRVLLISQEGTAASFAGLYEILQTLEVIPLEGARERGRDRFTISGANDTQRAQVEARFQNGQIKGWIMLWGPDLDADAALIQSTMRDSFRAIEGVLPSTSGAAASTVARRDLIAGLEVRRPVRSRSGFFINAVGTVVTTAEAVQGCGRVTIDEAYLATVRSVDEATGIAVLVPSDPLVPLAFAQFAPNAPAVGAEVRVSGFSFQDTLTRPIITFGSLSDLTGLNGEADLRLLTLTAQPGDAGGPVFDGAGAVIGMLLPRAETPGRMLPDEVNFAVSGEAIQAALAAAGATASTSRADRAMSAEMLTRMSGDLTVLVSCWN